MAYLENSGSGGRIDDDWVGRDYPLSFEIEGSKTMRALESGNCEKRY